MQRYFGGRAEAKSFAVADAAFAGRKAQALEELRWAMDGGTASVLVTSAMAGSARSLARFLGAPNGMREATWPASSACRRGRCARSSDQSRAWTPDGISAAAARGRRGGRRHQGRRRTTRRTRSSGWCSPSPTCAPVADAVPAPKCTNAPPQSDGALRG